MGKFECKCPCVIVPTQGTDKDNAPKQCLWFGTRHPGVSDECQGVRLLNSSTSLALLQDLTWLKLLPNLLGCSSLPTPGNTPFWKTKGLKIWLNCLSYTAKSPSTSHSGGSAKMRSTLSINYLWYPLLTPNAKKLTSRAADYYTIMTACHTTTKRGILSVNLAQIQ